MDRQRIISLLAAVLLVSGCSYGGLDWLQGEPVVDLVWPERPAAPRLRYLGSIDEARNAGLAGGLLSRIRQVVLGNEMISLVHPSSVVMTEDQSYIVVADPGVPGVHVLSPAQGTWRIITESEGQPLIAPVGLALDGPDRVWITDSGTGAIYRLDLSDLRMTTLPVTGILEQPVGIVVVEPEGLAVVDAARHRIVWLDRSGRLIAYEGTRGTGEGEFNYPTMIAVTGTGELIVSDTLNFRIQIRGPDGRWNRTISGPGDGSGYLARPKGVAADYRGNLYVAEGLYSNISIFDLDTGGFNLSVGGVGPAPGEFRLPVGLFFDASDRLFVADSQNGRIQVFRYVGND